MNILWHYRPDYAGQIPRYLTNPEAFQNRLEQARRLVAETLEWSVEARSLTDPF